EDMGSKEKHWRLDANERRFLVKLARNGTGEHWSEKIAAELAELLGVPHPPVELGMQEDAPISLTLQFGDRHQTLIHGNELLTELDPSYPATGTNYRSKRAKEHTVEAVCHALRRRDVAAPAALQPHLSAFGAFVGYLMLDALIGNTDRHHENWGVLSSRSGGERMLELAPSYDHASSLGREITDKRRVALLQTNDQRMREAYFANDRSAFYLGAGQGAGSEKPLSCLQAFEAACTLDPGAAEFWLTRLDKLTPEVLTALPQRVPAVVMSSAAKEFAAFLLSHNHRRLKALRP
ncbi:MAG TPA: HipA domain-containing protein, partial [Polyangiaceae bacterium]|nr:HipA domain-containing protein [Polyangiaceae bacterium]